MFGGGNVITLGGTDLQVREGGGGSLTPHQIKGPDAFLLDGGRKKKKKEY